MNWTTYWVRMPEEEKMVFREMGARYLGFVDGIDDDGSILTYEAMYEIRELQLVETEVLEAHADWIARTKAKFETLGVEWTTENLNRYSRLWEHE
ncbi:hypothetical protein BH11ACT6_BH11ACT6_53390 [soil metagenome]